MTPTSTHSSSELLAAFLRSISSAEFVDTVSHDAPQIVAHRHSHPTRQQQKVTVLVDEHVLDSGSAKWAKLGKLAFGDVPPTTAMNWILSSNLQVGIETYGRDFKQLHLTEDGFVPVVGSERKIKGESSVDKTHLPFSGSVGQEWLPLGGSE